MRTPAFTIKHQEAAIVKSPHGGRIPAGGNEAEHLAGGTGNVDDGNTVGVGAGDVEAVLFRIEGEGTRGHPYWLTGRERDIDLFFYPPRATLIRQNVDEVGIGARYCQACG